MVVGDPEQTIFTWRYANMENLNLLTNEFKDIEKIYFKENYRSTQIILRGASSVMQSVRKENRDLNSNTGEGEKIVLKHSFTAQDEINFICEEIQKIAKIKKSYKGIAVLFRQKYFIKDFEENFSEKSIPYTVVKTSSFFASSDIQALLNYLRIIQSPNEIVKYFIPNVTFKLINIRLTILIEEFHYQGVKKQKNIQTWKL